MDLHMDRAALYHLLASSMWRLEPTLRVISGPISVAPVPPPLRTSAPGGGLPARPQAQRGGRDPHPAEELTGLGRHLDVVAAALCLLPGVHHLKIRP